MSDEFTNDDFMAPVIQADEEWERTHPRGPTPPPVDSPPSAPSSPAPEPDTTAPATSSEAEDDEQPPPVRGTSPPRYTLPLAGHTALTNTEDVNSAILAGTRTTGHFGRESGSPTPLIPSPSPPAAQPVSPGGSLSGGAAALTAAVDGTGTASPAPSASGPAGTQQQDDREPDVVSSVRDMIRGMMDTAYGGITPIRPPTTATRQSFDGAWQEVKEGTADNRVSEEIRRFLPEDVFLIGYIGETDRVRVEHRGRTFDLTPASIRRVAVQFERGLRDWSDLVREDADAPREPRFDGQGRRGERRREMQGRIGGGGTEEEPVGEELGDDEDVEDEEAGEGMDVDTGAAGEPDNDMGDNIVVKRER